MYLLEVCICSPIPFSLKDCLSYLSRPFPHPTPPHPSLRVREWCTCCVIAYCCVLFSMLLSYLCLLHTMLNALCDVCIVMYYVALKNNWGLLLIMSVSFLLFKRCAVLRERVPLQCDHTFPAPRIIRRLTCTVVSIMEIDPTVIAWSSRCVLRRQSLLDRHGDGQDHAGKSGWVRNGGGCV